VPASLSAEAPPTTQASSRRETHARAQRPQAAGADIRAQAARSGADPTRK
jgi:hypothetical protein